MKNCIWDLVLCAIASSSLCYSCLIAFIATKAYQPTPWLVVLFCTVVVALLFVIARNFLTSIVGSIILVVATCVCAGVFWSLSSAESLFDDVVGNDAYLVLMVVLVSVVVFVLSRRKALILVLLIGGLALCATMEYLYWEGQVIALILFCVSVACLYAYRNYQGKLLGSDSERISFGSTTVAAGIIGIMSVLLAIGVFALIIAPQDPPSLPLKLLTKHVRINEEHVIGTGDEMSVLNDQLFSWNVSGTQQGDASSEEQSPNSGENEEESDGGDQSPESSGSSFNIDNTDLDLSSAVRIRVPDWLPIIAPFAVLLVVALVIAARKLARRRRYNRIRALPPDEHVKRLYLMYVDAFRKMKMPAPTFQTLSEYAMNASAEIGRFEGAVNDTAFADLTRTYSRVVYGAETPNESEVLAFDSYYRSFYKRARKYVGSLRYIGLFFRV